MRAATTMLVLVAQATAAVRLRPPVMKAPLGRPQAILFDADGTLLNSLPPHIDFCHKMNDELSLDLPLPSREDIAACRRVAAAVRP